MRPKRISRNSSKPVTSKRQRLERTTDSSEQDVQDQEEKIDYEFPDVTWDAEKDFELCSHCKELNLGRMFAYSNCMQSRTIGLLKDFKGPTCPFCAIIWRSIRIHWKFANPLVDKHIRPRLYVQNVRWSYATKSKAEKAKKITGMAKSKAEKILRTHRVMLAISYTPPGIQQTLAAKKEKFVLTEMDLISKLVGDEQEAHPFRRAIQPYLDTNLLLSWLENGRTKANDEEWLPEEDMFLMDFGSSMFSVKDLWKLPSVRNITRSLTCGATWPLQVYKPLKATSTI